MSDIVELARGVRMPVFGQPATTLGSPQPARTAVPKRARAAAKLAAVTAGRMNRLYAQGVISAQRRDEAAAANVAARANAAAAEAQKQKLARLESQGVTRRSERQVEKLA